MASLVQVSFFHFLIYDRPSEKLIEGLKSPDTSSLMLPDLLSLSDPFGGSVEESAKGASAFEFLSQNALKINDG